MKYNDGRLPAIINNGAQQDLNHPTQPTGLAVNQGQPSIIPPIIYRWGVLVLKMAPQLILFQFLQEVSAEYGDQDIFIDAGAVNALAKEGDAK